MKYAIIGDLHARMNRPARRTDVSYQETLFGKLQWCLEFCYNNKIKYLLQPGDFFDSFNINPTLMHDMISMLREFKELSNVTIVTIHGQHDLRYHQKNYNATPLGIMKAAEAVIVLSHGEQYWTASDHFIHGCNWEEEPLTPSRKGTSTLLIHKMLIDKPLWPGQDATYGDRFLFNNPYDLIVSGDNHKKFMCELNNRFLINPGSVMRSSIDQINHTPTLFVYYSVKKSIEEHLIPCKPIEEVMDLSGAGAEKEHDRELREFVDKLRDDVEIAGLDYLTNLSEYIKAQGIPSNVTNLIDEAIRKVQGE